MMGPEMMLALLGPMEAPGDVDWSLWDDDLKDFLRQETGCVVSRRWKDAWGETWLRSQDRLVDFNTP